MSSKAKSINLFLSSGDLSGLVNITEKGEWENGELFFCPREKADELLLDDVCERFGVYLLISKSKVYVGQSGNLRHRIEQHLIGKEWWEKVVLLTKKDNSLERSDIDYLEAKLIELATECGTIDVDNRTKGNTVNKNRFDIQLLDQYLEEALFLMELVGVTVFQKKKTSILIDSVPSPSPIEIEIREKKECIEFLKNKGITFPSTPTYAKLLDRGNRKFYYANPAAMLLKDEWYLALNDQIAKRITLLKVGKNTFDYSKNKKKGFLNTRKDKDSVIHLELERGSLVDYRSGLDFSPYVTGYVEY